jgi:hypothetical protein
MYEGQMKVLVLEPMFTALTQEDVDVVLPNLLKSIGLPPSCLILDQAESNLGVYLQVWADKMDMPVEKVKMSPFISDLEQTLVGHLRGVEKADAVIAFWRTDASVIAAAVRSACARKGIPLVCYYVW